MAAHSLRVLRHSSRTLLVVVEVEAAAAAASVAEVVVVMSAKRVTVSARTVVTAVTCCVPTTTTVVSGLLGAAAAAAVVRAVPALGEQYCAMACTTGMYSNTPWPPTMKLYVAVDAVAVDEGKQCNKRLSVAA